ncbi:MAG: peptidase E [Anaerolineales bacterium]
MRQIIAMGGGGFSMEPENLALDRYVLEQTHKPNPKVCFIPTASGDADSYILNFYKSFATLPCQPNYFSIFRPPSADIEGLLLEQDVLYVGGGSTRSLMALWREFGMDKYLLKVCEAGTILAGISAGANCWFEDCSTDSLPGELQALQCLGYLKGSFCPHYDGEAERRASYHKLIGQGFLRGGYAADDGAALHFIDEELVRVVSSRPNAKAYLVKRNQEQVQEEALESHYLG